MIATLTGIISEKINRLIVLDVNGVGYGVQTTLSDDVSLNIGEKVKLYIYENIKEDAHDLIGFLNISTRNLFEQLISVKNVGPKVALAVLDSGTSEQVRAAIAGGDVKFLQSAKGVGKRAAEQMVVELRDKVGQPVGDGAENLISRSGVNAQDEAIQALISLGYSEMDAVNALANVDSKLSTEDRIKQALVGR